MVTVDFYFDCSSPWTYLAFEGINRMAKEVAIDVRWKPILVGGVFNAVNPSVEANREKPVPLKAAYVAKDMQDWARRDGLRLIWPPSVFPVNAVKAMRGCFVAADEDKLIDYARAVFFAYWSEDKDISQEPVLADICAKVGLDADTFFAKIADQTVKDQLRATTEELIARGGFGSPTIFVGGDDMYFGNDRMPLVRDAVERGATERHA